MVLLHGHNHFIFCLKLEQKMHYKYTNEKKRLLFFLFLKYKNFLILYAYTFIYLYRDLNLILFFFVFLELDFSYLTSTQYDRSERLGRFVRWSTMNNFFSTCHTVSNILIIPYSIFLSKFLTLAPRNVLTKISISTIKKIK